MGFLATLQNQPPAVRAALSVLAGVLAGFGFYAANRKLAKRARGELAVTAAIAVTVIVWLMLQPQAGATSGGAVTPTPPGAAQIVIPPGSGVTVSPLTFTEFSPNLNYDPSVIFENPAGPPQTATLCGCSERMDVWAQYIQQLWTALDQWTYGLTNAS